MDISSQVRRFMIDNFLFEDNGELHENTSFLENGIIDSTGVLELIDFLENTFGIKIEDHEMVPENLDSIARIAAYVWSKTEFPGARRAALN